VSKSYGDTLDTGTRVGPHFVLPEAQYLPTDGGKRVFYLSIPFNGSLDLSLPELAVILWGLIVYWAAMPEAPVHKYGEARRNENEIGASGQGIANPVAQALLPERLAQDDLGASVATSIARHATAALFVCQYIRQSGISH
jgi:hypothetical protein